MTLTPQHGNGTFEEQAPSACVLSPLDGTTRVPTGRIVCGLSEVMGRHRLSQTALAQASGLRQGTISALYHDRTDSISKSTLSRLLEGLRNLTGVDYGAGDILHFRE